MPTRAEKKRWRRRVSRALHSKNWKRWCLGLWVYDGDPLDHDSVREIAPPWGR